MVDKEKVYLYIDEAGTLDAAKKKDRFFILSCCIATTPEIIESKLELLRTEIENDPYFASELIKFKEAGFHACDNHPDIRTRYYSLLYTLNIRIYSLVLDKESDIYKDLMSRIGNNESVYYELLRSLLNDRLIRNRNSINILTFEEYGSKPFVHKNQIEALIASIIKSNELAGLSYEVKVSKKSDLMLSVVDYVNYVIFQMLHNETPRMRANFKLIEPKIAILHHLHKKIFYKERKRIIFDKIKGQGDV